jgi:cell wall assembly regulator SMI1
MANEQNNFEHIQDQLQRGLITVDQANVMKVQFNRVAVVTSKLPASVRKALNNAVKSGELAHMKKDGIKPEVYYHPNFKYLAIDARNKAVADVVKALKAVCI